MLNAIILVNKPRGISSNTVVGIVKRALKADKAGHLGTLDVAGEGLLPVTLGKGTKLFDYFLNKDKVYETVFKFGTTTDTLDMEGEITKIENVDISEEAVAHSIKKFIGRFPQMPPAYSAKKINGQKAYDLARAGKEVLLRPKEIEIYDIKLIEKLEKNTFRLFVHCSSGTYIRSLCRDIAQDLSTCGVMQSILRTKCGKFDLNDAFSLEEIKAGKYSLVSLENVFNLPSLRVSKQEADKLLNGITINVECENGKYKCFDDKQFLGVIKVIEQRARFELRLI